MKKANLTLETIAKAVLVIAVLVIVLIIFSRLMSGSQNDINQSQTDIKEKADACIDDPESPDCFINSQTQGDYSKVKQYEYVEGV